MYTGYRLKMTAHKGQGVFATQSYKSGDVVIVGVIKGVLDGNDAHASQIGEHLYVRHAGLISKVNHSCDPDCGIRVNKTGAHDFVARRDIGVSEEITFDYAMRNYEVEHFAQRCTCGAQTCRGKITGWKDLSKTKKEEYKGLVAPYLIALDTVYPRDRIRSTQLRDRSTPNLRSVVR